MSTQILPCRGISKDITYFRLQNNMFLIEAFSFTPLKLLFNQEKSIPRIIFNIFIGLGTIYLCIYRIWTGRKYLKFSGLSHKYGRNHKRVTHDVHLKKYCIRPYSTNKNNENIKQIKQTEGTFFKKGRTCKENVFSDLFFFFNLSSRSFLFPLGFQSCLHRCYQHVIYCNIY